MSRLPFELYGRLALFLIVISIPFLGGCSQATEVKLEPESTTTTGPGLDPGPGPAGVSVAPNASWITARVISATSEGTNIFFELEVIKSQPIPGSLDFGSNIVGERITARIIDEMADPLIWVDKVIAGELRYAGGETTSVYLLSKVEAQ